MKKLVLILCLMCSAVFAADEKAASTTADSSSEAPKSQIYIKMGEAQTKKSLIAFPALQFAGTPASTPRYQSIGAELFKVIFNDLSVSTYFQFIPQTAYLEDPAKTGIRPAPGDPNGFKFEPWKQIGTEFLVRGSFSVAGDTVTLETYTYHVPRGVVILGKKYRGSQSSLRRIAHTFCNDLMEAMTGQTGMYLSRLVAASDRSGGSFREIYVMDWDGSNLEKITNHKSVALSPTWSPDATKIAYTAFVQRTRTKTRNADMFIYEMTTGKRWLVSYRQGLNSGANFAPDNEHLYLTLSQAGNPDIYKMNIDGSLDGRITNGPRGAMNVEPSVSPDGKHIAFSSDRSGQPMIYVMNIDGTNVKRITFAGKYNATPSWSPDGKRLAFAGWSDDHFDIFTMNSDGTDMIRITTAKKPSGKWAQNEDPCFSPDGRHLTYTSNRTGTSQIYISNLDGSDERRVTFDSFNYFKPKWSKNIE